MKKRKTKSAMKAVLAGTDRRRQRQRYIVTGTETEETEKETKITTHTQPSRKEETPTHRK